MGVIEKHMYDDGTAFFLYQCMHLLLFIGWMDEPKSEVRSLCLDVVVLLLLLLLLCCGIVLEVLLRYLFVFVFVLALMGAKSMFFPSFSSTIVSSLSWREGDGRAGGGGVRYFVYARRVCGR